MVNRTLLVSSCDLAILTVVYSFDRYMILSVVPMVYLGQLFFSDVIGMINQEINCIF